MKKIDPNSAVRRNKINLRVKLWEINTNNPNYTRNSLAKELGCSDSTFKKHRNDLYMDSSYIRNKKKKKNPHASSHTSTIVKGALNPITKRLKLLTNV